MTDLQAPHLDEVAHLWQLSFETSPRGIAVEDTASRTVIAVNPAFAAMHGGTPADFAGRPLADVLAGGLRPETAAVHERLAREGRVVVESEHRRLDGTVLPVRAELVDVRDEDGAVVRRVGVFTDLTEERRLEAAGRRAVTRFERSFDEAPVAQSLVRGATIVRANAEMGRLLGLPATELAGQSILRFGDPEHPERVAQGAARMAAGEALEPLDRTITGVDGRRHEVTLRFTTFADDVDEHGVPLTLVHCVDRTADLAAGRELAATRQLFEAAFESAPVGKMVSRRRPGSLVSEVVAINPAFLRMLGLEGADLLGSNPVDLVHPDDVAVRDRIAGELLEGLRPTAEMRFRHADGRFIPTLIAPAVVSDAAGGDLFVLQALDISERKAFERRLRHLADHDVLTGLPNRRRLEEELAREAARSRLDGASSCLLLLDLDGFKDVNDLFGHSAGDELLTRIAAALQLVLREADVVARVGGDEFAVILPAADEAAGRQAGERLLDAVRDAGRIVRDGRRAEVSASAGLTLIGGPGAADAEGLLVEADIAMYQAKDAGRDRLAVYDRRHGVRAQLAERTDWLDRLRRAVREEAFVLHAQPLVPLAARDAPPRYELLLRLTGEDGALVEPGRFLHHAERHGLIADIDRWVLGRAVALLHEAQAAGRDLGLSVNFSARTVQDLGIARDLEAMLARRPVRPGTLTIEVTETAAITDVRRAAELAGQLRELGCRLSLDDFGAGFASFSSIKHLAFDELKIDGGFVDQLPSSPTDQLIVRAVTDLARGLGAEVVAERVGDDATVALLRELGVDHGQGYFLGRPAPLPPCA